jgi:hypothetical protein
MPSLPGLRSRGGLTILPCYLQPSTSNRTCEPPRHANADFSIIERRPPRFMILAQSNQHGPKWHESQECAVPSLPPPCAHMLMRSSAPAPSQKRDSKPLGDLFESLEDVTSPKLKPDVKSSLPVVKKPGSWDSENGNGMSFTCQICCIRQPSNNSQAKRRQTAPLWSSDLPRTSQKPSKPADP